ncbi:hypothetical protein A2773_03575 [Candidatus Gottesmanbacteria bacterium RIFCSPHIGHO2_01_FULL_39_10]|uniref:DNA polymerase III delta N-terminal domain-containing protein n=1 Tax=Candidatus Gottesmanbacteria bacterium RIFCSPHIGHO2_01_FULL_39_10 TaxID=1798375 RepID=A0A1F5ZPP3_9BACT|nr:MAG: hypothetical protein A2773_03575 [Candidatus Gottesmanbacteria bacterium RIFCSPHIGHO2_01_FULL_39_10]
MHSILISSKDETIREEKVSKLLNKYKISIFNRYIIKKDASIGIEDIRKIKEFLKLKSNKNENRGVIIYDLDKGTPEAQNALLKILEEPPPYTYIICTSRNPASLLPTIISRTTQLDLINNSIEPLIDKNLIALLLRIPLTSTGDKISLAQNHGAKKDIALNFLESSIFNLRFMMNNSYRSTDEKYNITPLFISSILKKFTQAKFFVEKNISPRLTLEVLFFGLK